MTTKRHEVLVFGETAAGRIGRGWRDAGGESSSAGLTRLVNHGRFADLASLRPALAAGEDSYHGAADPA